MVSGKQLAHENWPNKRNLRVVVPRWGNRILNGRRMGRELAGGKEDGTNGHVCRPSVRRVCVVRLRHLFWPGSATHSFPVVPRFGPVLSLALLFLCFAHPSLSGSHSLIFPLLRIDNLQQGGGSSWGQEGNISYDKGKLFFFLD